MEHFTKTLMRANKIFPTSSNLKGLNNLLPCYTQVKNLNNKTCIFTKLRRPLYLRQYPTVFVESDGSTYTARHYEPRYIIKLPFDLSKISAEERALIMSKRKPKEQAKFNYEEVVTINVDQYVTIMKKNQKRQKN